MSQDNDGPLRVAIVLPGLHRFARGAEVSFEAIGQHLANQPGTEVTLFGSGPAIPDRRYAFQHVPTVSRARFERFPNGPLLRNEFRYEELTFLPSFARHYRPGHFDVTMACSLPSSWFLARVGRANRPRHIFVTNNGNDGPTAAGAEGKLFAADGVVFTNPMYQEEASFGGPTRLISNGVDPDRFQPGPAERERFGLPADRPVVLMASALYPVKRLLEGAQAVSELADAHLMIAGDGPLARDLDALAADLLPGRYTRLSVAQADMAALYRSADVFLHMNYVEPFGNVYIEAAASGVPIVGHDSPSTRWMLGSSAGLVETVHHANVVAGLRQALLPEARDVAAAASAGIRDRFAWSAIGDEYLDFMREIASN